MKESQAAKRSSLWLGVALYTVLAGFVLPAHADGLARVEQSIFGMDCAPCAYGIEHGLKRLPGVTDVRVSLNEGAATLSLVTNSTTTLENIRKIIRDNGFTPKAAQVVVVGKLVQADGNMWLEATGLPRYRLTGATAEIEASLRARKDTEIRIEGEVPESASTSMIVPPAASS